MVARAMAGVRGWRKFTASSPDGEKDALPSRTVAVRRRKGWAIMAGLAMVMFIALFAFGNQFMGWEDPGGRIQLALVSAFLFGIICGYRVKA